MVKNIYEEIYSDQKNLGNLTDSVRIKKMLSAVDQMNLENQNIMDIGCYDGTLLSGIKNRNNNFFGLEASDWGVEKSRKKNIDVRQYFFDDKSRLPFENNYFDVVVAGEIIEHIYDTDFFLEEIRRVLKLSGHLIISTPNIASFGRRILLLFGKNPLIELSPNESDSSGHIRYFTFKSLEQLLEKHEFKIVSSESDCINFSGNGKMKSAWLAKVFPRLGASIIYSAIK
jgi:methionine biosynthesis protein MetW